MCPVCGADEPTDSQTGYHDAGEVCPPCKAKGFAIGVGGVVLCPECGDDYMLCACASFPCNEAPISGDVLLDSDGGVQ